MPPPIADSYIEHLFVGFFLSGDRSLMDTTQYLGMKNILDNQSFSLRTMRYFLANNLLNPPLF